MIDEREQGITIDIAFKYFKIQEADAMFIDSLKHIEFTRNMANAATFANIALLMIDVKKWSDFPNRKAFRNCSFF